MDDGTIYGSVLDALGSSGTPSYQIAIPSYQRAAEISGRTLATLDGLGVDRDRVTIFVADAAEAEAYAAAVDGWRITVGLPGLFACRRWYANEHYPEGTRLLHIDDDVDALLAKDEKKLVPWDGTIDELARIGFVMAEAVGAHLWGTAAAANPFYMGDVAVAGLRYICGILHGTIAGDPMTNWPGPAVSSGADFERSLRCYRAHGAVVRIDWLCPKTTYFGPGGMQAELGGKAERSLDHARALRRIAAHHSGLARAVRKADGTVNLRLSPKTIVRVPRESIDRVLRSAHAEG